MGACGSWQRYGDVKGERPVATTHISQRQKEGIPSSLRCRVGFCGRCNDPKRKDKRDKSVCPLSSSPNSTAAASLNSSLPGLGAIPVQLFRYGVFPYLSGRCLTSASGACTLWREVAVEEELWKPLCLRRWQGKHVPLLETKLARTTINTRDHRWQAEEEEGENNVRQSLGSSDDETQGSTNEYWRQSPEIRAASLKRGLEDLVADMSIREMKKRLEDLGANPRRLGSCLEKEECVSLLMGSLLLSREGLLRVGGQLPPWLSSLRGWRWSYYFADVDSRRCWLTMDDLVRCRWTLRFPADVPFASSPVLLPSVTCEFRRDYSYTSEVFHPDSLDWHFEDNQRCVKVNNYPGLEAERNESWGWQLVNAHAIFSQQRPPPP